MAISEFCKISEVKALKKGIHPEYEDTTIRCACGNEVSTRSTKRGIIVDVCSKCHPFYTGRQRFVDTGGRVRKFEKRLKVAQERA